MNIRTFDRQALMSDNTREEILDIIFELQILDNCRPNALINMMYGLFDGFDYSEMISNHSILDELESELVDRIVTVAETIQKYF
jgi:hypothetical protein